MGLPTITGFPIGHCALCSALEADSLEFETGNNAEYAVDVPLCEDHLLEAEDTGYDFEVKYADQILECLYEDWRTRADVKENE